MCTNNNQDVLNKLNTIETEIRVVKDEAITVKGLLGTERDNTIETEIRAVKDEVIAVKNLLGTERDNTIDETKKLKYWLSFWCVLIPIIACVIGITVYAIMTKDSEIKNVNNNLSELELKYKEMPPAK